MRFIRTAVLGILGCMALGVPQGVEAAPILQIDGSGVLTGATGVDVAGTLYDVAFLENTCVAIFSGCVASAFDFTTAPAATAASQALVDQVFVGLFDDPDLTFGCAGGSCYAMTPYAVSGTSLSVMAAANFDIPASTVTGVGGVTTTLNMADCSNCVFADWTVAATAVPEPTSLLLLGSGIAGVAMKARRRRKQQVQ